MGQAVCFAACCLVCVSVHATLQAAIATAQTLEEVARLEKVCTVLYSAASDPSPRAILSGGVSLPLCIRKSWCEIWLFVKLSLYCLCYLWLLLREQALKSGIVPAGLAGLTAEGEKGSSDPMAEVRIVELVHPT